MFILVCVKYGVFCVKYNNKKLGIVKNSSNFATINNLIIRVFLKLMYFIKEQLTSLQLNWLA